MKLSGRKYYNSFADDLNAYAGMEPDVKEDNDKLKSNLKNPDLIEYLKDDNIRLIFSEMNLDTGINKDYDILVTHSAIFEEEITEQEESEDFKDYIQKIEKSRNDAPEDFKDFIKIDGGSYDLQGLGKQDIKPFAISKYPVTNKWLKQFIDNDGYINDTFWSEDGKKWLKENTDNQPGNWNDSKFNHPGKPVVGVSWFEAEAFCNWLNQQEKNKELKYRLLSEEEWQAAAGGKQNREYPWGNDWDFKKCNNNELDLGQTSVVGIFMNGNTPEGICDMAGNVWEWTNTEEGPDRVIRGGSWFSDARNCRVSGRDYYHPDLRDSDLGFRLAHSL